MCDVLWLILPSMHWLNAYEIDLSSWCASSYRCLVLDNIYNLVVCIYLLGRLVGLRINCVNNWMEMLGLYFLDRKNIFSPLFCSFVVFENFKHRSDYYFIPTSISFGLVSWKVLVHLQPTVFSEKPMNFFIKVRMTMPPDGGCMSMLRY